MAKFGMSTGILSCGRGRIFVGWHDQSLERAMKKLLLIISICCAFNCYAQNVMEVALADKSKLVFKNTNASFNLKDNSFAIQVYLEQLRDVPIDSLTLIDLIKKSKNRVSIWWQKEELGNVYLVIKDQPLSVNKVLKNLYGLEEEEVEALKKQVRQYNNQPSRWRGWPIAVSKPIYSDDKQYCLLSFVRGNNGGHCELYMKVDSAWERIAVFNRFAF